MNVISKVNYSQKFGEEMRVKIENIFMGTIIYLLPPEKFRR